MKYRKIAEDMATRLQEEGVRPGMKLPTESELAKEFSVTHVTIRRALGVLEDDGLISRRQGRGTFFTGGDAFRSILYLGSVSEHIYGELFLKIQNRMTGENLRLFALPVTENTNESSPDESRVRKHLADTDAVIIRDTCFENFEPLLKGYKNRIVVVGHRGVESDVSCVQVLFDRQRAVEAAVEHLHSLGHRRISLFLRNGKKEFYSNGRLRKPLSGNFGIYYPYYLAALHRHGIGDWDEAVGEGEEDETENLLKALSAEKRLDAIVADMDYRARTIYVAAKKLGLSIPEDFSVVGIGDTPWARAMTPAMTSVNLGVEEAADIVCKYCSGKKDGGGVAIRVQPWIVERESTWTRSDEPKKSSKDKK